MTRLVHPDSREKHTAILGKNGSGKTTTAKSEIVEPLLAAGKLVAVVDPTSAWWGLRTSADGKGPGFKVLVLGGDHGDLPLPANGGAAVARLIIEQRVSVVLDTGNLTVGERTRWMIDFAGALYRLSRTPLYLVIDEAHVFAPQGKSPDPDTGKMLHAVNQLASGGRSRGIRLTMITQRPQKLHKDALTTADTLIAMRVLAPQDRAAVKDWIDGCGDPAQGKQVLDSLAQLQRGEGWVWYPEGGHLQRGKFPPIRTFDSSATPTEGSAAREPKGAADIDLTEIRAALAAQLAEDAVNDPKRLRADLDILCTVIRTGAEPSAKREWTNDVYRKAAVRAAELHAEARNRGSVPHGDAEITAAEERGHARGREEGARDGYTAGLRAVQATADRLGTLSEAVRETVDGFLADLKRLTAMAPAPARRRPAPTVSVSSASNVAARKDTPRRVNGSGGDLPPARQKLLDKLAWLESMGLHPAPKETLAAVSGVSPTSGGYFNNLGVLRSSGLIDYPQPGTVCFTDAGRTAAAPVENDGRAVHEHWLEIVDAPQRKILERLIQLHPKQVSKDDLARDIGVSETSGGYFNDLGRLRTVGAIDYPQRGFVGLTRFVMP